MELQEPTEQAMVRTATDHLSARFDRLERPQIESTVSRLVSEWCERARVKTFVGLIAERHARAELERTA